MPEKTYDYKALIEAYLSFREYGDLQDEFSAFQREKFHALSTLFNIRFIESDIKEHRMRQKIRLPELLLFLFDETAKLYVSEEIPLQGALEIPEDLWNCFGPSLNQIGAASHAKKKAMFDLMCLLVDKLYDGTEKVFTSAHLRELGFEDSCEPELVF
jgi:hypothetical protein